MSVNQDAPKANPDARQPNGQFARGNKGGPGNPYARQVAAFRSLLMKCVTADDFVAVAVAVVEKAKQGDIAAARLLFQYTLGRPVANPHPDRLDHDELQAFRANAAPQNIDDHMQAVPLGPALELLRGLSPCNGDLFRKTFREMTLARFGEDGHGGSFAREQAADDKRQNERRSKPTSADPSVAFAEAETLRLVTDPDGAGRDADRRAANPRQP
jgi:hypothetical protein